MGGLFDGTALERPVTCERCHLTLDECRCPRSEAGDLCPPSVQQARVRREKRGGGKVVTVVTGLDPSASDLKAMLKTLRSKCAAGGSIEKDGFSLQGDHADRVVALLKEMGYPAKRSGG